MNATPPTPRRRRSRWLNSLMGTSLVAVVILLAGCATVPGSISAEVSQALQNDVVALAESAAAGDTAGATNALAVLETRLNEGLASNSIDAERGTVIQRTIELVRADLVAMTTPVEETPAPVEEAPAPVDTPEPVATTPVEETPTVEPAPTVTEEPTPAETEGNGNGDGNNGNGNNGNNGNNGDGNNGNGNGNNDEDDSDE